MKLLCVACGRVVSGQQVRLAFACMVELGLPVAEARGRTPICLRCARRVLWRGGDAKEEESHATTS